MECNYCKKVLSNLSALKTHQKKTKYCLIIQGKSTKGEYSCTKCKKSFLRKKTYQYHNTHSKCANSVDKMKKDLASSQLKISNLQKANSVLRERNSIIEEQLKNLQERYDKLATTAVKKPTTTNTNTYNIIGSPLDLSQEALADAAGEYTLSHFCEGGKGTARLMFTKLLRDKEGKPTYICTDRSRYTFRYKDGDGISRQDPHGEMVIEKFIPKIRPKISQCSLEWYEKIGPNTKEGLDQAHQNFQSAVNKETIKSQLGVLLCHQQK